MDDTHCDLAEAHDCEGAITSVELADEFDGETVEWCETARAMYDGMLA
jgi:hypothetical protein